MSQPRMPEIEHAGPRTTSLRADGGHALVAIEINDPAPLAEMMQSLGIEDPGEWTLHTDKPPVKLDVYHAAIDIGELNKRTELRASKNNTAFSSEVKLVAAQSILGELATRSGSTEVPSTDSRIESYTERFAVICGCLGAAVLSSAVVSDISHLKGLETLIPFTVITQFALGAGHRFNAYIRDGYNDRDLQHLASMHTQTVSNLSSVIMPIYYPGKVDADLQT